MPIGFWCFVDLFFFFFEKGLWTCKCQVCKFKFVLGVLGLG